MKLRIFLLPLLFVVGAPAQQESHFVVLPAKAAGIIAHEGTWKTYRCMDVVAKHPPAHGEFTVVKEFQTFAQKPATKGRLALSTGQNGLAEISGQSHVSFPLPQPS